MRKSLEKTHGVMVYQEQIMQLCQDLAGFSLAEADGVRKAIGKKDHTMMEKYADKFVSGAGAGQVEVELEDGRVVKVHRNLKLRVVESSDKFTIEEVFSKGFTLLDTSIL